MTDAKYGVVKLEKKDVPEGEPVFVLRGQDRWAPVAIAFYASVVGRTNPELGADVQRVAANMLLWQADNFGRVKDPD